MLGKVSQTAGSQATTRVAYPVEILIPLRIINYQFGLAISNLLGEVGNRLFVLMTSSRNNIIIPEWTKDT